MVYTNDTIPIVSNADYSFLKTTRRLIAMAWYKREDLISIYSLSGELYVGRMIIVLINNPCIVRWLGLQSIWLVDVDWVTTSTCSERFSIDYMGFGSNKKARRVAVCYIDQCVYEILTFIFHLLCLVMAYFFPPIMYSHCSSFSQNQIWLLLLTKTFKKKFLSHNSCLSRLSRLTSVISAILFLSRTKVRKNTIS